MSLNPGSLDISPTLPSLFNIAGFDVGVKRVEGVAMEWIEPRLMILSLSLDDTVNGHCVVGSGDGDCRKGITAIYFCGIGVCHVANCETGSGGC